MVDKSEKITQELVFDLADRLTAQGVEPTNLRIRELNGNRGSLTSITPLLKAWREQRTSQAIESLPDMPTDRLLGLLQPVWAELAREAQALFKAEQTAFDDAKKRHEAEVTGYIDEIDRQSNEIESVNLTLSRAIEENQDLKQQLAALSERERQQVTQISSLQHDIQLLKSAADESNRVNATLNAELAAAKVELTLAKESLTLAKEAEQEKAVDLRVAENQLNGLKEQLGFANQQITDLKRSLELSAQASTELEQKNAVLTNTVNNAERNLAELKVSLLNASEQLAQANSRADIAEGKLSAFTLNAAQQKHGKSK